MKRPSKQELLAMMRPEVRYNHGSSRLNEAVELRSGIIIAEYTYTQDFLEEKGHHYQRKLVIKAYWDRAPLVHVLESGYVDQLPTKES